MVSRNFLLLVVPALALPALAGDHYVSDFAGQCASIGINFEYVDPNGAQPRSIQHPGADNAGAGDTGACIDCHVPHENDDCMDCHVPHPVTSRAFRAPDSPGSATFPQPLDTPRVGEIDGLSGASGDFYYGAGSYLDAHFLMSRVNGLLRTYQWVGSGDGIVKLRDACELPDRQHVAPLFPDDGKPYQLQESRNQMGAKTMSTVNRFLDEVSGETRVTPNIATIGYGMLEEDGRYYVNMLIGKNNTCFNAVTSGDVRLSYYEFDKSSTDKQTRNRGARIIGRVDYARTALMLADFSTGIEGFGAGDGFDPADVDWDRVGSCSLIVEVTGIIPLG